ncbi:ycaC protein [Coprinopsis cinerea okayama7|uniref:YcaC protein n=1 Tax=Coprinopsis cinerea (strain Okayama-7 / 130 / ATCC MYA-4618 / FGSC 9003) TaxID=240176 RepID=A8NLA9_COPC7|nr:ycaC protein [Coprinopsis cinerea okayama7\|eukprot:XP_001834641.1 ycaC protein [Coprinopsis cinerea okayama7\
MLFHKSLLFVAAFLQLALAFEYVRIDKNNAALVIIDHQVGLMQMVRDQTPEEFRNNVFAHAALGALYNLPTVITSSAESGPNGPIPQEILDMHPNATIVRRGGEVNSWDSEEFKAAVRATGKNQIIIAGITTDVCTTFAALSLTQEGYTVFANSDASGTMSKRIADEANARMRHAGVQVLSMFAISAELMRDWRATPGAPEMIPFYDRYLPAYAWIARAHAAAIEAN